MLEVQKTLLKKTTYLWHLFFLLLRFVWIVEQFKWIIKPYLFLRRSVNGESRVKYIRYQLVQRELSPFNFNEIISRRLWYSICYQNLHYTVFTLINAPYHWKSKWVWPRNTTNTHCSGTARKTPQNTAILMTSGRQLKLSNKIFLPHEDDCKTRKGTNYYITKSRTKTQNPTNNGNNNETLEWLLGI